MRVRAGLITAIYKKALVLSNDQPGNRGDIVNIMSVDATRMQDLCAYGLIFVSGPFQASSVFVSHISPLTLCLKDHLGVCVAIQPALLAGLRWCRNHDCISPCTRSNGKICQEVTGKANEDSR